MVTASQIANLNPPAPRPPSLLPRLDVVDRAARGRGGGAAPAPVGNDVLDRALADPGSQPLVDRGLEAPELLLILLVAAEEVADIVAGAAVAALGHALLGPALELVRDRDVHLCHRMLIYDSAQRPTRFAASAKVAPCPNPSLTSPSSSAIMTRRLLGSRGFLASR